MRAREQSPQKGCDTDEMKPISPAPSAYTWRSATSPRYSRSRGSIGQRAWMRAASSRDGTTSAGFQ